MWGILDSAPAVRTRNTVADTWPMDVLPAKRQQKEFCVCSCDVTDTEEHSRAVLLKFADLNKTNIAF